jgi:hypothetical protein
VPPDLEPFLPALETGDMELLPARGGAPATAAPITSVPTVQVGFAVPCDSD